MESRELERRPCGASGLDISVLGVGCWAFGGKEGDYWGAQDDNDARSLIAACLERGVTYLDVAEAYNDGRSEEALGRILEGRRGEAIIGTKIGPQFCTPSLIREHCEASLRRLRTDYIDIYMVHWPIREHSVPEAFETLKQLRDEGKIRVIGVSNFGVRDLTEAADLVPGIGINQLHYNLLSRGLEAEILPLCRKRNIGVMTYMSLLQGILTGKWKTIDEIPPVRTRTRHFRGDRPDSRHGGPGAEEEVIAALDGIRAIATELGVEMGQLALGWLAAQPGVTCVLAGARNVAQLESNIQGVTLKLSDDVLARLDATTRPVFDKLGSDADYWQSGSNSRIR
ncbi:MAG: hypothetical protein PWP23_1143 [Candidatus Sumerlaeota bacterium]|nr:hypothetical protein [Candidatus Sumerlaeota bacterium]